MSNPTEPPSDEEPLLRIAARRAVRRARDEAATPEFGRLLAFHASGAAGDLLIGLALAGSLFFSVPEAEARDQVVLYLVLTMTPFAIVAPILSRVLDRSRMMLKLTVVLASLGRGLLAWMLATRLESLLMFPLAFGVLILSRTSLVVRGAILPELVPEGRTLVHANSSLSKAAAVAGLLAVVPGLVLIRWPGVEAELLLASAVYFFGALPALGLPMPRGRRRELSERMEARLTARALSIRQAIAATTVMRFLVGFLILHLAFALRREGLSNLDIGALAGSALAGSLIGAILAPRFRRLLREEGILVLSLVFAGTVSIVAGQLFSLTTAVALVGAFGIASGASKVAFDSVVQRDVHPGARGWAFARFEAVLQLAWVLGGIGPVLIAIPAGAGAIAAGVLANAMAIIYILGRRRAKVGPPE